MRKLSTDKIGGIKMKKKECFAISKKNPIPLLGFRV
jgi:hypothetical protein